MIDLTLSRDDPRVGYADSDKRHDPTKYITGQPYQVGMQIAQRTQIGGGYFVVIPHGTTETYEVTLEAMSGNKNKRKGKRGKSESSAVHAAEDDTQPIGRADVDD